MENYLENNLHDRENYLDKVNDRLQCSWSAMRANTAEQQDKQCEFEWQKLKEATLMVGDWVFENNPTLKKFTKHGKLSLPYCGPFKVIKINYLA